MGDDSDVPVDIRSCSHPHTKMLLSAAGNAAVRNKLTTLSICGAATRGIKRCNRRLSEFLPTALMRKVRVERTEIFWFRAAFSFFFGVER
jgi:hypothetical protein